VADDACGKRDPKQRVPVPEERECDKDDDDRNYERVSDRSAARERRDKSARRPGK